MQAAGYTLDLYCDNPKGCPNGGGQQGEYVNNERNCKQVCYREARADGWKLAMWGGIDLCPTCSGKKPKRPPKPKAEFYPTDELMALPPSAAEVK